MSSTNIDKARGLIAGVLSNFDEEDLLIEFQRQTIRRQNVTICELRAENDRLKQGKKLYWKGIGRVVGLCESAVDDSETITIEIENLAWWGEVNANAPAPTTEMVVPQGSHRLGQKVPFEGCKIL